MEYLLWIIDTAVWFLLVLGVLAITRRFWLWLFGIDALLGEMRALRYTLETGKPVPTPPHKEPGIGSAPAPMGGRQASPWPD